MYISAKSPPAQYHPITNPQTPAEGFHRQSGQELPHTDTVTISSQAKHLAAPNSIGISQDSAGSRKLAYGDLIYGGPPTMSFDEISARMDLWEKYQDSPIMDSFRRDAIKLYELEKRIGTPDEEIGEKLMSLYEDMHIRLSKL